MNDLLTVERVQGITPHCETTLRNSECPYIEMRCLGCASPQLKQDYSAIDKTLKAIFEKGRQG